MADWSKPALESTYANFVEETNARDTDLAVMFDPAVVTPTNFPTNTVRWRAAASKWEKWNGTAWGDLATTYAINISGTAVNVTGVVAAVNGGTGQSSYTVGDLIYASGATALAKLTSVAVGNVLLSGGVATAPTWGKVDLTAHVSGTLPVANGGTGVATLTGIHYGNGASATTAATAAQIVAAIGATAVANATTATTLTTFAAGGLSEIGRYLDFHSAANGFDYDVRLDAQAGASAGTGVLYITASTVTSSGNVGGYSDERLKKNWQAVPENFIERLAMVKSGIYDRIDLPIRQVGVSAQSLQKLLPDAVPVGNDGILSVVYGNAALVACVELAKEIVALRAEVAELKK